MSKVVAAASEESFFILFLFPFPKHAQMTIGRKPEKKNNPFV